MNCVFCEIVAGTSPASVVYQDQHVMAFMGIQPTAPGECMVIPTAHIDHFIDLDDETAQFIMRAALRIGRRMMTVFKPVRVGMVVHGFGVPHAHLIVVPQQGTFHITSDRFATVQDGRVVFSHSGIPQSERSLLDQHARLLADE
jgi:histidine triad (HIT) family protein